MRTGRVVRVWVVLAAAAQCSAGCGTTRMTDTTRAASEMLLISQAVDEAVARIDFSDLAGKTVYFDEQYLDKAVDKGYVVSSLRQHLLAHGALLKDNRETAAYVVEARTGGLGTDKHSLLFGTPQITLPSITAIPITNIPEIALVKKTDQKGVAKLAVFAYHRETGQALWRSGLVEASSNLKDTWVFGAGPFSRGSIRRQTELAGEPLPPFPTFPQLPFVGGKEGSVKPPPEKLVTPTGAWAPRALPDAPVPSAVAGVTGPAALVGRPVLPVVVQPVLPPDRPDPTPEPPETVDSRLNN